MAEAKKDDDQVWMTSAMLKAYAHPLRRRMIRLFSRREHLRAADVAADLDVPANSASFHLRVLADAGLIEEAPEHARDRRDRVWKSRRGSFNVGDPEHPVPDEALGTAMVRSVADDHQDMLSRVIAWTPEYLSGRATEMHAAFSQRIVRLTEAEFEAVMDRVQEVITEAVDAHDKDDPAGRPWQIDVLAADDTI
ncbi:putative ArsR family transcriptional regulator [Microbacterium phyllosphaerae]|uniref:ArsR family transcriptional regulator n=1 Tax=Microbacterium phyllosphaerae TaxID=124798 RepID=A0ABS4WM39_9MICO|nr:helix-turn-helix domain-containing protein [Microbacterium phyllosphaerae]MBP2377208.1 putative ArsR family transcriptional regulator [Microbacterium phyllosphaerae]MCS3442901.1 putative ArsR family transcriptional regulator [Microbacterium phyllosphaerae]